MAAQPKPWLEEARRAQGFERHSLFEVLEPVPIDGLYYRPDYITASEEQSLIAHVDTQPWSMELQRRRQWYGWAYDDTVLGQTDEYVPQPLPEWLKPLAERLYGEGWFPGVPDRALINEYFPGQGIGAHKDRDAERIQTVAIISLGGAVMMDFTRPGHAARSYYLQPRSLVIMRGEARHHWLHGIVGRKSDRVGGLVQPRTRRLSLTFRHVGGQP